MKFVLRYINVVQAGYELHISKTESIEEFDTLEEALKQWHILTKYTDSTVFEITHGDEIYDDEYFYQYCEDNRWEY